MRCLTLFLFQRLFELLGNNLLLPRLRLAPGKQLAALGKQLAPTAPLFGSSPLERSDEALITDPRVVFRQGQDLEAVLASHSSRHAVAVMELAAMKEANAWLKEANATEKRLSS